MSLFKDLTRLFFLLFLVLMLPVAAGAEESPAGAPAIAGTQATPPATKSADTQADTSKPVPHQPTAAKPAGAKSAEQKPAPASTNAKAAEQKPDAANKQAAPKQATSKPSDAKSTATKEQAQTKPATATEAKPENAEDETAAKPELAKPAGKQILVNVDKSTQQMTVFVDGIEEHRWPVSTGVYGYTTPSGSYTASSMNDVWYSKQWDNAPMPNAIFFTKKGHAIHGSLEVKKLGRPASHGCVRLSPTNAKTLYQLVKANGLENTQVVIGGETPGGEARIASQPNPQRYGEADGWGGGGYYPPPPRGYYPPPRQQRRGFFGRQWFDPYRGQQGYYRPPRGYYRPY
jgi:lipoprotein-anchoring transpeptidase ErfK/SrfK